MFRKTLTILSFLGLLLSVGLWGASYFSLVRPAANHKDVVSLTAGVLLWGHYVQPTQFEGESSKWYAEGFRGFATQWAPTNINHEGLWWQIGIPLWIPSIICCILWLLFDSKTRNALSRNWITACCLVGLLASSGSWGLSYFDTEYTIGRMVIRLDCGGIDLARASTSKTLRRYRTEWRPSASFNPTNVFLPLWIPTLLFGSLSCSSVLVPIRRRRKRRKLGLCLNCGYDLRASEGRCPECGGEFGSSGVEELLRRRRDNIARSPAGRR
jgi:general stress protein CsbA